MTQTQKNIRGDRVADTEPIVVAEGVTVRYGPTVAVDSVDFSVKRGEIMGIVGPNGAGKTSLVESLEGLRVNAEGTISVAGLDPSKDRAKMAKVVGVQLQDSVYPTRIKVREICQLFASFYEDPDDADQLLEEFQLTDRKNAAITKLSGGQRQRLSLVLALIGRPEVVFLDELTNGLDPQSRRNVWEGLRRRNEQGLTIILTSHYMDEVEYLCDRVTVIVASKIIAVDTVEGLIRTYTTSSERIVIENRSGDDLMRGQLAQLEPDVALYKAGNRTHIDIKDPSLVQRVQAILDEHHTTRRQLGTSLEDVYLELAGDSADSQEVAQ